MSIGKIQTNNNFAHMLQIIPYGHMGQFPRTGKMSVKLFVLTKYI